MERSPGDRRGGAGRRGLLRLVRRGHRRGAEPALALADDGSLRVLGASWDPARSDSAAVAELAAVGVDLERPLLVRHHLRLPDGLAVEEAARLLSGDGYALVVTPAEPLVRVRASRSQRVTGLSLAQERSRMAGLAQRLGGDADGWDVLGPVPATAGTAGRVGQVTDSIAGVRGSPAAVVRAPTSPAHGPRSS